MAQTFTVPKIAQNSAASPQTLNAPLNYIQDALNKLEAQLNTISNKSAVIQWEAPVNTADVSIGDLVYYNTETQRFQKAKAALAVQYGQQGQSVQAPSSRVQGIVLSIKVTDNSAVLLKSGYYQSDIILNTVGTGAKAGIYFLSPTNAGKATLQPGWNMRQPCISYYGDGKFSMLCNYLAHDNHHHASFTIPSWTSVSAYGGTDIPSGAQFYYAISSEYLVGQLNAQTSVVFLDGKLNKTDFVFTPYIVWYKGTSAPANNTVTVFNVYPFAYGDSVVRSIISESLDISNYNGNVHLNMPDWTVTGTYNTDRAISGVSNNNLTYTPIVSQLRAGQGVSIRSKGQGIYQVDLNQLTNSPLSAQDIQLNGTQRIAEGLFTYTVFPSGSSSNYVMTLPVYFTSEQAASGSVKVWATQRGPGSNQLTVDIYWMPLNTQQLINLTLTPIGSSTMSASNTQNNKLLYIESQAVEGIPMNTSGILMAKVSSSSPGFDVYIHQTGFKVDIDTGIQTSNSKSSTDVTQAAVMNVLKKVMTFNPNY